MKIKNRGFNKTPSAIGSHRSRGEILLRTLLLMGVAALGIFWAYQILLIEPGRVGKGAQKMSVNSLSQFVQITTDKRHVNQDRRSKKDPKFPRPTKSTAPRRILENKLTKPYAGRYQQRSFAIASSVRWQTMSSVRELDIIDELLNRLSSDDVTNTLWPEEASQINQLLQGLMRQGTESLTAINAFLESGDDIDFGELKGGEMVDYRSLRIGLIDVLNNIGGAEAINVMRDVLNQTGQAAEISLLAHSLEVHEPGVYREEFLIAAQEAMSSLYQQGGTRAKLKAGPLFELLQSYGDANSVAVLEKISTRWPAYTLVALAKLPNGEGIPTLIDEVSDKAAPDQNILALSLLAQASIEHFDAGEALLELARSNAITQAGLFKVALALKGYELYFSSEFSETNRVPNHNKIGFAWNKRVVPNSVSGKQKHDENRRIYQDYQYLRHTLDGINRGSGADNSRRLKLIRQLLETKPSAPVAKLLTNTKNQLLRLGV